MKTKKKHIQELENYKEQFNKLLKDSEFLQSQLGINTTLTQWKIRLELKNLDKAIEKCKKN